MILYPTHIESALKKAYSVYAVVLAMLVYLNTLICGKIEARDSISCLIRVVYTINLPFKFHLDRMLFNDFIPGSRVSHCWHCSLLVTHASIAFVAMPNQIYI